MRASLSRSHRRRGFSLIEVAILLAVLGVLLGGIVLPLGTQLRERVYHNANAQILEALDAVVGYAVINRSPGVRFAYGHARQTGYQFADIAAGRPYLPCPDTDGDGLENRRRLALPILGQDGRAFHRPQSSLEYDSPDGGRTTSNPLGGCETFFGGLPWRTLGLRPTDPWGSQLSYVVNPNFAIGAFGFDQQTRAGTINYFTDFTQTDRVQLQQIAPENGGVPLVPCPPLGTPPCSIEDSLALDSRARTELTADLNRFYDLYNLSSRGNTASSLYTDDEIINFIDGLPFAVLSHGQNKLGAGTRNAGGTAVLCTSLSGASAYEQYNAFYSVCNSSGTAALSLFSGAPQINIYAYNRVTLDPGGIPTTINYPNADTTTLDDIVGWLTKRELASRLRAQGVFPVPVFAGTFYDEFI